MDERILVDAYSGDERRRRWPGEFDGKERRQDSLLCIETDQEPDQSPLAEITVTPEKDDGRASANAAA
jgi:hypothetical protein